VEFLLKTTDNDMDVLYFKFLMNIEGIISLLLFQSKIVRLYSKIHLCLFFRFTSYHLKSISQSYRPYFIVEFLQKYLPFKLKSNQFYPHYFLSFS
jgi:hypothetical protein